MAPAKPRFLSANYYSKIDLLSRLPVTIMSCLRAYEPDLTVYLNSPSGRTLLVLWTPHILCLPVRAEKSFFHSTMGEFPECWHGGHWGPHSHQACAGAVRALGRPNKSAPCLKAGWPHPSLGPGNPCACHPGPPCSRGPFVSLLGIPGQ